MSHLEALYEDLSRSVLDERVQGPSDMASDINKALKRKLGTKVRGPTGVTKGAYRVSADLPEGKKAKQVQGMVHDVLTASGRYKLSRSPGHRGDHHFSTFVDDYGWTVQVTVSEPGTLYPKGKIEVLFKTSRRKGKKYKDPYAVERG